MDKLGACLIFLFVGSEHTADQKTTLLESCAKYLSYFCELSIQIPSTTREYVILTNPLLQRPLHQVEDFYWRCPFFY